MSDKYENRNCSRNTNCLLEKQYDILLSWSPSNRKRDICTNKHDSCNLLVWGEEAAYGIAQKIIPALESTPVNEVALNFSVSALLSIPTEFVNKLKICGPVSVLHSKI